VANGERLFLFGLIHIAGLSTYRSINYTVLAVCSSLREPIRVEWRDTNLKPFHKLGNSASIYLNSAKVKKGTKVLKKS